MNRQELRKKVRHTVDALVLDKGFVSPLDVFLRLGKKQPLRFSKSVPDKLKPQVSMDCNGGKREQRT